MADNLSILLSILLNKSAQSETEKGIDSIDRRLQEVDKRLNKFTGKGLNEILDAEAARIEVELLNKEIAGIAQAMGVSEDVIAALPDDLYEAVSATYQLKEQLKGVEQRAIASRNQFSQISSAASQAAIVSRGILLTGIGVVGGLFAFANKYAQDAERATRVTKQWQAEMDLIRRNGDRIGAVVAKEVLPYLDQATRLTGKIATFIEQNPELIKTALTFGTAAAAIGAIGTVTFRAIETFARVGTVVTTAQIVAAKLMNQAADKQLAAAGLSNKGALGGVLGRTVGGVSLGSAGAVAGGVTAFVGLSLALSKLFDVVYEQAQKMERGGKLVITVFRTLEDTFTVIPGLGIVPAIRRIKEAFEQLRPVLERLGIATEKASGGASKGTAATLPAGTLISNDVLQAYIDFRENIVQIEKDAAKQRVKILESAAKQLERATADGAKAIAKINSNYQKTVDNILKDARRDDIESERKYVEERAKTIRDGGREIQRIEEDLQERLRQLRLDHEQRLYDLSIARDALGIIQEQRRYDQERAEAERSSNIEIARRRQDLAVRLQEMQREHEAERAQRTEQLKQRLDDAAKQHEEDLKEQRKANEERMREIRLARDEELRELEIQKREELARNRQAFIAQIRDLDAALLGETKLRQAYYQRMLKDAQAFFEAYRAAMPSRTSTTKTGTISGSTGSIPSRQFGGYVPGGLVNTHAGEYVLNRDTTRAFESLIGGRLSERALLGVARGGGNVTLNDERRFYGGISSAERRMIQEDTLEVIAALSE